MSDATEKLAINGGTPVKETPYGTGKRFGSLELRYLEEALNQNTLLYGTGTFVKRCCEVMATYTGVPYVTPCSSGSAAIHLGLIACGIGPGDEVIVTPNTDSGSVLGIIEEGAVPIFCDSEKTLQPSVRSIEEKITERTRAVVVVHLAGYPAPVDEIVALCEPRGIGVVEDCAQSWGAKLNGKMVGSFGTAGAYSVNDYKHISCGDGGFVAVRDPELYRRVSNYADKHYDRLFDGTWRQHHHGVNYRMSELQGAVALAQLEQVDKITARHHEIGELLTMKLADLPGAEIVQTIPGGYSSYWWTVLIVDEGAMTASRDDIVAALQAEGVGASSYGGYDLISKPIFQQRLVRPWLEDERKFYPFRQPDGREYFYSLEQTPIHAELLRTAIQLHLGRFFSDQDVAEMAAGIQKVFRAYCR